MPRKALHRIVTISMVPSLTITCTYTPARESYPLANPFGVGVNLHLHLFCGSRPCSGASVKRPGWRDATEGASQNRHYIDGAFSYNHMHLHACSRKLPARESFRSRS